MKKILQKTNSDAPHVISGGAGQFSQNIEHTQCTFPANLTNDVFQGSSLSPFIVFSPESSMLSDTGVAPKMWQNVLMELWSEHLGI